MMVLVPKIDEVTTRENVRELLKKYWTMKRMSSFEFSDSYYDTTGAITYSDMPKSQSNRNNEEYRIIKIYGGVTKDRMGNHKRVKEIDRVIESLPNKYATILRLSYCAKEKHSINEIAAKLKGYRVNELGVREEFFYSTKNIEKLKSEALIYFAEAYDEGQLLAYEK
ncbi:ArpU family phage packaging/lysis transcriptional regulator [Enterococcus asini]|uniref:hypothetical protein n=1 Tax=Enterococcus asini TaxID=57732 RepID=UPI001E5034B4|nr:hypothetical protein [Enterococcus asini]MCD5029095.1 hypothetical protein [Enterococcus asini]